MEHMLDAPDYQSIETQLRQVLKEILNCDVTGDDTLVDLGLDSIGATLLVLQIEERFNVEVSVDAINFDGHSIRELAALIGMSASAR